MAPVGPRSGDAIFSSIDRVVSSDFKVFAFFICSSLTLIYRIWYLICYITDLLIYFLGYAFFYVCFIAVGCVFVICKGFEKSNLKPVPNL